MILKSVTPRNFGPFASDSTLAVHPEVTVLTGPNDTGKSSLLRLLHLICSGAAGDERDYNRYRMGGLPASWRTDPEFKCELIFQYSDRFSWKHGHLVDGDILHIQMILSPEARAASVVYSTRNGARTNYTGGVGAFPKTILIPSDHEVGERIDLTKMNPAEDQFVRLGFGAAFGFEHYKSLSDDNRTDHIMERQLILNDKLKDILPPSLPLRFELRGGESDKLNILRVAVVDSHRGATPLGSRGTGVRKVTSIMGALLSLANKDEFTYILLDEPETSLHADAQHSLRRVLEGLASRPNIQVIYATHSPSMVNTMRPTTIRVLKRDRIAEKATSIFINNAFDNNFFTVRSSLGLNPADSLLYAPITVIVEGPSEVRCLPLLLEKLKSAVVPGFEDVETVLSQTHFLEGTGDSFEYMCRLAKSQGAKPVIFLDGDKRTGSSSRLMKKLQDDHGDVPVVTLPTGEEFEQVVPAEKYIEAVRMDLEDTSGKMTLAEFEAWKVEQPHHDKKGFSKLVEDSSRFRRAFGEAPCDAESG